MVAKIDSIHALKHYLDSDFGVAISSYLTLDLKGTEAWEDLMAINHSFLGFSLTMSILMLDEQELHPRKNLEDLKKIIASKFSLDDPNSLYQEIAAFAEKHAALLDQHTEDGHILNPAQEALVAIRKLHDAVIAASPERQLLSA